MAAAHARCITAPSTGTTQPVSTNTGANVLASLPHAHISPDEIYSFDARGIAKRYRHAAIFGALDALNPGETMRLVNDHDPLTLLHQLRER
jgi:hypothetical protein